MLDGVKYGQQSPTVVNFTGIPDCAQAEPRIFSGTGLPIVVNFSERRDMTPRA